MIRHRANDPSGLFRRGSGRLTIAGGVPRVEDCVCAELLNITRPKSVAAGHERLLRSGARILFTNTSGAAPQILDRYRMHDEAFAVSYLAAEIASRVAEKFGAYDDRPKVVGDVRVPWHLPKRGYLTGGEIEDAAASMTAAQIAGGVDAIHLRAVGFPGHLAAAFAGAREGMGEAGRTVPVMVSVAGDMGVTDVDQAIGARDLVSTAILAHGLGATALSIAVDDDEATYRHLSALTTRVDTPLFLSPSASESVARNCISDPTIGPRLAFVGADSPAQAWRLSRFAAPPRAWYSCPVALNENAPVPLAAPFARSGGAR